MPGHSSEACSMRNHSQAKSNHLNEYNVFGKLRYLQMQSNSTSTEYLVKQKGYSMFRQLYSLQECFF